MCSGMLLEDLGQIQAAEAEYRRAIGLFEDLAARFPAVGTLPDPSGRGRQQSGRLARASDGRLDEAETIYRRNLEYWKGMAAERTRPSRITGPSWPSPSITWRPSWRRPAASRRRSRPSAVPPTCARP